MNKSNKKEITKEITKETNLQKNQENKDKYKKPEITYTDKLSKSQIRQLLFDYEEIKSLDELQKIEPGTHLRYFENKDNELKFRTGGILTVIKGFPDYLILNNGKLSWSVQIKNTIFFKRITVDEIKKEYQSELTRLNGEIKGLHTIIKELQQKNKELEMKNKFLERKIK